MAASVMFEQRLVDLMDAAKESGLSDDDVFPMNCCGLEIPLGDTSFGTERVCDFGMCVEFVCICGQVWASAGPTFCPCSGMREST